MTSSDYRDDNNLPQKIVDDAPLVRRSKVEPSLPYPNYKQQLRYDFLHSCGYCTITEAEASAIRFTIDHYEPKTARPDLENEYGNLIYSCDTCNILKGNRCPPSDARAVGRRFFRPDEDAFGQHFKKSGILLRSTSNVGEYSIDALDLNRLALRKLRNIRERLSECDEYVIQGVLALRKFPIDRLPQSVKGSALRAIKWAEHSAERFADDIDSLLRDHARSELIDPDPEAEERSKERAAKLRQYESVHPGIWRGTKARQR